MASDVELDLAVCLPQDATTVGVVRHLVAQVLGAAGVARACIDDIRLAVSEACTNVIEHAASEDRYEVRLNVVDGRCSIRVSDAGARWDVEALATSMPDAMSPRGRGVAIMRATMDHVAFRSEPRTGTIVHLVKSLQVEPGSALDRVVG